MSFRSITPVLECIDHNSTRSIESLNELIRRPSVSAKAEGIQDCAHLVGEMMQALGVKTRILEIGRDANPLVYGELKSKKNPKKTVLFYNHYDVQPPEPLELWNSPPFEPVVKDGKVFGRGAADDKSELVGRLKLTEAFLEIHNDVPCNFKFIVEGEEEIGSKHLNDYIKRYQEISKADAVIWEFGGVDANERPIVTLGVKGILYVELASRNAKSDAHSSIGAIVDNPAWRLVWALSKLKKGEQILIPGWYDDIKPLSNKELRLLDSQPFDEGAMRRDLGIRKFIDGMKGKELRKALASKPTCTICGLNSGYTGPGSKTVLPKSAYAKIDFRLVPNQDPKDLKMKLGAYLRKLGFSDIEIRSLEMVRASRTSPEEPIALAAKNAAKFIHGKNPVISISSGVSGPMYLFKAPCVAIGGDSPFSRKHAPNEYVRIDLFVKGMKWVADTVNRFSLLP